MTPQAMGARLRALRKKQRLTQGQLAERMGISRTALAMAETQGAVHRYATLVRWAGALGYEVTLGLRPQRKDIAPALRAVVRADVLGRDGES